MDFLLSLVHFAMSCQGYEVIGVFQFLDARKRAKPRTVWGECSSAFRSMVSFPARPFVLRINERAHGILDR
jgi:hypothetical protein